MHNELRSSSVAFIPEVYFLLTSCALTVNPTFVVVERTYLSTVS